MPLRFLWTEHSLSWYFGGVTSFTIRMMFLCKFSVLLCYFLRGGSFRYLQYFIVFGIVNLLWLSCITTCVQSSSSCPWDPPPKGNPPKEEKKLIPWSTNINKYYNYLKSIKYFEFSLISKSLSPPNIVTSPITNTLFILNIYHQLAHYGSTIVANHRII